MVEQSRHVNVKMTTVCNCTVSAYRNITVQGTSNNEPAHAVFTLRSTLPEVPFYVNFELYFETIIKKVCFTAAYSVVILRSWCKLFHHVLR